MPIRLSASDVTARQVRAQCDRILGSKIFVRSRRQIAFLDYIVTAELEGRSDTVKEYTIGIDVFEKGESFDPNLDSIVRVEASRLRAKLREYYEDEGAVDPIRIDIPKGHYIPVFHPFDVSAAKRRSTGSTHLLSRKAGIFIGGLVVATIAYLVAERYVFERPRSETGKEIASVSTAPSAETEYSIAVLPFRNRSAIADDAYFVDGIHDDILTQLSKQSYLEKVISRTSMEQYRDTMKSMVVIGQELGVTTILEGSVQRAGDRVRINAQLIDAVSDRHVWSETYDRDLTTSNIFAIQSEISLSIALALKKTLSPEERQALARIPTENLRAYEFFQQAQQIRRTQGLGSQDDAARLLEQAVSTDPNFALAYVGLARAYIDRYFMRDRDKSHRALARIAIDKAMELSPGMPEAYVALADFYYKGFLDYDRALDQLNYAIPLAPGNAEAYAIRAFVLRRRGNFREAQLDLARAIELDAANFSPYYVLADTYVILGQYEEAIAYYDKAIELAPTNFGLKILRAYALTGSDIDSPAMRELISDPDFFRDSQSDSLRYRWEIAMLERDYDLAMNLIRRSQKEVVNVQAAYYPLDLMRGLTEFYLGDTDTATGYFNSAVTLLNSRVQQTPDDARLFSALGFAFAGLGERQKAVDAASTAAELYPLDKDAVDGSLYIFNYAKTYAMLGEDDAAILKLQELLSRPANWYATLNVILREPTFENLHDLPPFIALMEKYTPVD